MYNLLQASAANDVDLIRTRQQLEARGREVGQLESKMATSAELLADKDSRLRQLEFSLLDVWVLVYLMFFKPKLDQCNLF